MTSIIEAAKAAGIVGAGGAGFPAHIKLAGWAEWVIANGAECEPLLRVDQQVARAYARQLVRGLLLAGESTGATRFSVAIKYKHEATIAAVEAAARGTPVEVAILEDYYPAGDEFNIVYEVTGRIIPEGGRPGDVGCLVQNIVTLVQLAAAVDEGRPVTSRHITIGGAVRNPVTVETAIGTPVAFCLEAAGGATVPSFSVLDGGPMMGRFIDPATAVVTKRTSGFLVFPSDHPYVQRRTLRPDEHQQVARAACDQCNLCTEFCPRYLLGHRCWPSKVMRSGLSAVPMAPDVFNAALCCECGLCSLWACPIPLPVREMMVQTRIALKRHELKSPFREQNIVKNEFFANRKVPVHALVERLGIGEWDVPAPLAGLPLAPGRVSLPLDGHAGAPARPLKGIGDRVRAGELVGAAVDGVSANVHSPVDGQVLAVRLGRMEIAL